MDGAQQILRHMKNMYVPIEIEDDNGTVDDDDAEGNNVMIEGSIIATVMMNINQCFTFVD